MYEKLSKKARSCMLVCECMFALVVTAVAIAVLYISKENPLPFSMYWIVAAVAIIWVLCIVMPFVRYERYRYRFTEEEIDVKEGFLFVERNIVPIERLHKVAMESGPVDRIFHLSKVKVTTAGGDVTIRFLETKQAEEIVERLKSRINAYAISSREKAVQKEDAKQ